MNIGVLLRHIGEPGGITVYTRHLLERLLRLPGVGHRFTLFLSGPAPLPQYRDLPNVTQVCVNAPGRLVWDQVLMPVHVRRQKIDLLFNPKMALPLAATCRMVMSLPGMEQFTMSHLFQPSDRAYFRTAMPLFCSRADAVLIMSNTGKRDLQEHLGVRPEKIHVVRPSCNVHCRRITDAKALDAGKRKYGIPERYILFVGGVTPLKNVGCLLRAMQVLKQKGFRHKLVMAGFMRWNYEHDARLIDELGLRDDVVAAGYVPDEDLPVFYNLADCFVLPSFYEGFGIPILEAQSCGCPVVCSTGGALPETAGEGALLFAPESHEALAGKIETVLTDPHVREQITSAGSSNAARFTWERTARETLAVFDQMDMGS